MGVTRFAEREQLSISFVIDHRPGAVLFEGKVNDTFDDHALRAAPETGARKAL